MSARERIVRYRTEGGAADLVRVEVLVPPEGRQEVVDLAARLRSDHRAKAAEVDMLMPLFEEAVDLFGARCLWNLKPEPTPTGMRVIAERLRKHGDMDAWRLASRIQKAVGHAVR
jgi:hypothetical protein